MIREIALLPLLAACAPARVPVDVAERQCFARATQAQTSLRATPEIGIGIGTGGYAGVGIGVGLTPRATYRRDAGAVYTQCIIQRTGAPPRVPLMSRKG